MGCLRLIALLSLILVAGYILPKALISDGTDDFEGLERYGAKYILSGFERGVPSEPAPQEVLIALLSTAYRVEDVGLCDGSPASEPDEPPPIYEVPMTPEEEEAFIRENQSPEFRDYPIEVFTGYWRYEIQLYTLFGIPLLEETMTCDERR